MRIFIIMFALGLLCDGIFGARIKGAKELMSLTSKLQHDYDVSSENEAKELITNICYVNTIYKGISCFTQEDDLIECLEETKSDALTCSEDPYGMVIYQVDELEYKNRPRVVHSSDNNNQDTDDSLQKDWRNSPLLN